MESPRLTVALTFDHDAISDSVRRDDSPVKFSHAEFGPRVGAKRILSLLARRGIGATWFVPGHTLTTFTDDTDAITTTRRAASSWSRCIPSASGAVIG